MNIQERIVHLHYCSSGNHRFLAAIAKSDPSFTTVYSLSPNSLASLTGVNHDKAGKFLNLLHSVSLNKLKRSYIDKGISYVTVFDENYPPMLKNIYDPPWVLYYHGNFKHVTAGAALSVVGTRHPSEYAWVEMKSILEPVIKKGVTIVSGLALGIDRMAHELAVAHSGKTAAVLGYGLNYMYPAANKKVFNELKENQLLITEYPPYIKPQKWHFPERNRIISGLSPAVFVVEAKERSGSLITAELAVQQNRDVLALPGRISSPESAGTNRLIQEGAKIILSAEDILEEYLHLNV
ncbi:DNA-processing protein DprA [Evansella clarkii]|uniref:DNA-processing protein DprA n=1 Tax=Evansella clarkii TaxID=79879 RepID=UPI0009960125|nr:DNA-processing protein DprA [Evansella clarkii]